MRKAEKLQQQFQEIGSLDELKEKDINTYYQGIHIEFLEMLFGEEWKEVFQGAYDNDIDDFMNDYIYDYKEWKEFEI